MRPDSHQRIIQQVVPVRMEDHKIRDVYNLLQSLGSSDNTIRNAAELQYESLKSHTTLPECLLSIVAHTNATAIEDDIKNVRHLCIVLLRQVLLRESHDNVYQRMQGDEMRAILRARLLECLSQEQEHHMRSSLCELVGNMCAYVIESREWPEITQFVFECIHNDESRLKEVGVVLLGLIAPAHMELFVQPSNIETIKSTLGTCLIDNSNESRLMLAAMKSFAALVLLIPRQSEQDILLPLLEPCMRGLQILCKNNNEDMSIAYIEILIDMAEESCTFFTSHLLAVFEVIMDLVESEDVISTVVYQLLEFIVTLCENGPKLCRKIKVATSNDKNYFSSRLLPFCARMMCQIGNGNEDDKWETADTVESIEEEEEEFSVGEQAFDRVTHALGVRSTFSVVLHILKNLLSNSVDAWKNRYAGLCIIANFLEVSSRIPDASQLQQHRADVCATLIAYAGDPIPRVRSAAFFGLAQFANSFRDEMLEEQVNHIVQILLTSSVLATNPSPRVRRSVLSALTALLHVISPHRIDRWTGVLLGQVTATLEDGPVIVQEECVTVIYSLAESTGNSLLANYYDVLMPVLKRLLAYAETNDLEQLWGTTLECCAMVGEASGKNKFCNDAIAMMDTLVLLDAQTESGSSINRFLLKVWVRIARCMGSDFLPYLRPVLQKILESVEQNVYEARGGYEDEALQDMEARSDVDVVEGNDGWVAVRTTAIEEQACACQLVTMLVERMQEDFFPYVEQTVRALAPLLQSPHEDIRCYVTLAMPELVRATAKVEKMPAVSVLTSFVVNVLIALVKNEDVFETLTSGLKAITQVIMHATTNWSHTMEQTNQFIKQLGPLRTVLELDQLKSLSECCQIVLQESMQRRAVLRAEAAVSGGVDDADEDDERKLQADNSGIYSHIAELVRTLLLTHRAIFVSIYLDQWVEIVQGMLHKYCLLEDQLFAISMTDAFLEFGFTEDSNRNNPQCHSNGDSSDESNFINAYMPRLSECCQSSKSPLMHQAAALSFVMTAERFPVEFSAHAVQAISALQISDRLGNDSVAPHDIATESSIFALGAILEAVEPSGVLSHINCNTVWGKWLTNLPLQCDRNLGIRAIKQLLRLLQQQHKSLFQNETQNWAAEAISVLLLVLDTPSVNIELSNEIREYLHRSLGNHSDVSSSHQSSICLHLRSQELETKLRKVLGTSVIHNQSDFLSSSPGMTAPIHTVLLGRNF